MNVRTAMCVLVAVAGLTVCATAAASPGTPSQSATQHAVQQVTGASAPFVTSHTARTDFQGGWDRDHFWFKATRADVFGTAISAFCKYTLPVIGWYVCAPIAALARQVIGGSSGVWAEIYPHFPIWTFHVGTW